MEKPSGKAFAAAMIALKAVTFDVGDAQAKDKTGANEDDFGEQGVVDGPVDPDVLIWDDPALEEMKINEACGRDLDTVMRENRQTLYALLKLVYTIVNPAYDMHCESECGDSFIPPKEKPSTRKIAQCASPLNVMAVAVCIQEEVERLEGTSGLEYDRDEAPQTTPPGECLDNLSRAQSETKVLKPIKERLGGALKDREVAEQKAVEAARDSERKSSRERAHQKRLRLEKLRKERTKN